LFFFFEKTTRNDLLTNMQASKIIALAVLIL